MIVLGKYIVFLQIPFQICLMLKMFIDSFVFFIFGILILCNTSYNILSCFVDCYCVTTKNPK